MNKNVSQKNETFAEDVNVAVMYPWPCQELNPGCPICNTVTMMEEST
jgi:hypothetical protein